MMTKFDWEIERQRQVLAGRAADDLVLRYGYTAPIDPLKIVELEGELLRAGGGDFKNSFDGKLKYFPKRRRFILLYNTKYDAGYTVGQHHPRTRFSIGHELGHYFLDAHREYLLGGGKAHASKSEFRRQDRRIEGEADAFAASLLLPTHLLRRRVNQARPTLNLVSELSREFETSPICTTFRVVRLSEDPCAVAGIRKGQVVWMFPSDRLIEGSCYPSRGEIRSQFARKRWEAFRAGDSSRVSHEGLASDWLSLFGRADRIEELGIREHYLPVQLMDTLVVLLTLDDNELFGDGAANCGTFDDDEEDYGSWTKERHDSGD